MDVHKLADDTASVSIDWAEVKPGVSWHPAPALIDGAVTIASSYWEGTLQTVTFAGGVPGRATQVVLRADPNGNHHHRRASSVVVHVIHDWRWLAPYFVRAEAPRLAELIEGADVMAANVIGAVVADVLKCPAEPDAVRAALSDAAAESPEAENALFDRLTIALDQALAALAAAA